MSEVLNTPFTQKHIALGAKMAPFAGYNMPISYTGINDEHAAVRNAAGVFDVSHMGEFILRGADALDLIQRVTSNDRYVRQPKLFVEWPGSHNPGKSLCAHEKG